MNIRSLTPAGLVQNILYFLLGGSTQQHLIQNLIWANFRFRPGRDIWFRIFDGYYVEEFGPFCTLYELTKTIKD
jgi:hypothetical protein